jgi:hypothetical protein
MIPAAAPAVAVAAGHRVACKQPSLSLLLLTVAIMARLLARLDTVSSFSVRQRPVTSTHVSGHMLCTP